MAEPSGAPLSQKRERDGLFLLFNLQLDRYALSVHEVVEVMPLRRLKAVPEAPSWVAGVFEYRGELVPVLDLLVRVCGVPASAQASTRLVLVQYRPVARVLGLILEKATDTVRLPLNAFRDSGVAAADAQYLGPVQHSVHGLVQRIDVTGLLPADVAGLLFSGKDHGA